MIGFIIIIIFHIVLLLLFDCTTDDEVLYCPSKFPRTYLPRQLPSFSNRPITTPASLNSTDDLTDRSGQDSDGLTSQQDEQTGIRSPASEDQSTSEDEHIVGMADIKIGMWWVVSGGWWVVGGGWCGVYCTVV